MEHGIFFLIGGLILGFSMAWNLGANDVANAMASAVGARAITIKQAVFIAGTLNVIGAVFIGGHVTETIRKGIVSIDKLSASPELVMIGCFSALFAASFWVFLATWAEMPVSSTHSIVGGMLGFGIIAGGPGVVHWVRVFEIVASWVISPFFSAVLGFIMFTIIRKFILEREDVERWTKNLGPLFIGFSVFIMSMSFFLKTPLGKKLKLSGLFCVALSLLLCLISIIIGLLLIKSWLTRRSRMGVEDVFRRLQIFTSCYVALSQGANDVANAVGPLAAIYFIVTTGKIQTQIPVPTVFLAFGGVGIAIGIFTFGYKVIRTLGFRITQLTNTRGFSMDTGTATTVLIASKLGLPVSTTHAAVGAVIGVGLARGFEAVNLKIVFKIIIYWLITLPIVALTCIGIFKLLTFIFL